MLDALNIVSRFIFGNTPGKIVSSFAIQENESQKD